MTFDWSASDGEFVVLSVRARNPTRLLPAMAGPLAFDEIDRTVRVRVETFQSATARRARPVTRRDQSGQAAGLEAIVFGLLTFVVGVLLAANAWAVVDAKMAMSAAAREATRAYVEAPDGSDPMALAEAAAREAVAGPRP